MKIDALLPKAKTPALPKELSPEAVSGCTQFLTWVWMFAAKPEENANQSARAGFTPDSGSETPSKENLVGQSLAALEQERERNWLIDMGAKPVNIHAPSEMRQSPANSNAEATVRKAKGASPKRPNARANQRPLANEARMRPKSAKGTSLASDPLFSKKLQEATKQARSTLGDNVVASQDQPVTTSLPQKDAPAPTARESFAEHLASRNSIWDVEWKMLPGVKTIQSSMDSHSKASAKVEIEHPELGPIQLEFKLNGQAVDIRAIASTLQAAKALRATEELLRLNASRRGIELRAIRVSTASEPHKLVDVARRRQRRPLDMEV